MNTSGVQSIKLKSQTGNRNHRPKMFLGALNNLGCLSLFFS